MNNSLVMVLLLGLLLLLVTAPFSILSVLMVFLLGSAIVWAGLTIVRTLFQGDRSSDASS